MKDNLVFISYRREDEGASAKRLKSLLDDYFGPDRIFMDVDNIRAGKKWTETIDDNLLKANVLIVVIGKNWLRLHDEFFRRRIDNEDDWVKREIELSMRRGIKIIPLYFGVEVLKQAALPLSINTLTNYQSITLSALNNEDSLKNLYSELEQIGFQKKAASENYPKISAADKAEKSFPLALSDEEIEDQLSKTPEWKLVELADKNKNAIERTYKFKKFKDAIDFMNSTSIHISRKQHHPEWENVWRTLRVRFTTWDIGQKVSYLDFEIARYMDGEYEKYRS